MVGWGKEQDSISMNYGTSLHSRPCVRDGVWWWGKKEFINYQLQCKQGL